MADDEVPTERPRTWVPAEEVVAAFTDDDDDPRLLLSIKLPIPVRDLAAIVRTLERSFPGLTVRDVGNPPGWMRVYRRDL